MTWMAPQRIVCLTAETAEIAFALGAGDRVVGVSTFADIPPEARATPRVSAFTTADVSKILALKPDLVLAFSDLQKDIVRELIGGGLNVLTTNQRTLDETMQVIRMIGRILGEPERAEALIGSFSDELRAVRRASESRPVRPRVYFEEWDEPLVTGIAWVGEMIEAAGGMDCFADRRSGTCAKDRTVQASDVVQRNPDIILASWCGKKFDREKVRRRPGWDRIAAVRQDRLFEIPPSEVLQPGPSLVRGLRRMQSLFMGSLKSPPA